MLTQLTKEQWQELRKFVADPKIRDAFQKMDLPLQYKDELAKINKSYELASNQDEKPIIEPSIAREEGVTISQLVEAQNKNELTPQAALFMDMLDASFSKEEIDAMIASGLSVDEVHRRLKEEILGKYGLVNDLTEEDDDRIRAERDSYIGEMEGDWPEEGIALMALEEDIGIETLIGLPEQELSPEQGEWKDMLLANFTEEELEILAGRGMTVNQLSYLLDEGMDLTEVKEKIHDSAWLNKLTLLSLFAEMDNAQNISEEKTPAQPPEQDVSPELSTQEAKASVVDVNIGLGDYSSTEVSSPEPNSPAADSTKPDATPELPASSKVDPSISR